MKILKNIEVPNFVVCMSQIYTTVLIKIFPWEFVMMATHVGLTVVPTTVLKEVLEGVCKVWS